MKLGEDESKIGEYYFKGTNDVANMSILTNRRLVVVYSNSEESYPLSKITAVTAIFKQSSAALVFGVIMAVIGLFTFGSNPAVGVVAVASGGGLAYLGWKGKTQLRIKHMGGEKNYTVRGKSPKLMEFMDTVNSKLA